MIAATNVTHTVLRPTHASNYLPIEGTLPEDKAAMLAIVDNVLACNDTAPLRPEWLRRM